jgi:hypothetical protein
MVGWDDGSQLIGYCARKNGMAYDCPASSSIKLERQRVGGLFDINQELMDST